MKIIKRQMSKTEDQIIIGLDDIDNYLPYCQASFNSDGNITLRNYDISDKNKDEIIILSESETESIFELFYKISRKTKKYEFPF